MQLRTRLASRSPSHPKQLAYGALITIVRVMCFLSHLPRLPPLSLGPAYSQMLASIFKLNVWGLAQLSRCQNTRCENIGSSGHEVSTRRTFSRYSGVRRFQPSQSIINRLLR